MMKRCPNPACESAFLFSNDRVICPFCHTRLIDSVTEPCFRDRTILPPDRVTIRNVRRDAEMPGETFISRHLGNIECHGRVSEIDHHELFNSKRYKLFNSLLRGEPYQFSHQTIEYTIRVESISDGFPAEVTDFCLYGSYLGRLQVGDEVVVRARDLNNRRIVKSIFNETTGSMIKPGLQIPAGIIRGMVIVPAVILIALICSIVWTFDSGAATWNMAAILAEIIPVIIVVAVLWIMIRSIFPRRRRR